MRTLVQPQPLSYSQQPIQSGIQQSMNRNYAQRPNIMSSSSTRPYKAPQQAYQFQQPQVMQKNYAPVQQNFQSYNQQSQIYPQKQYYQQQQYPYQLRQQAQYTPQIAPRLQSQNIAPQQVQPSFRPASAQFLQVRQSMPQQFIAASPARGYQNFNVQHQLTPNRLNQTMYSPQNLPTINIQQQNTQTYNPSIIQQKLPQFAPQVFYQSPQETQQYKKEVQINQDTSNKVIEIKQAVQKPQKAEDIQKNVFHYEQESQQQSDMITDDNLQDLALQYEDGYIYRGQGIEPSTRQGYGILCDSQDNEVYSGNWQDNQYHGHGRLVNFLAEQIDGNFDYTDLNVIENGWIGYEGGFNEGKMTGKGVLTLTNGEKFDGTFEDGTIEGVGAFHVLDGQVIQGIWKDGNLEQIFQ